MRIQTVVAQTTSLAVLYPMVKHATPGISFWGKRYVTVEGYEGKLNIHEFGVRASELNRLTLSDEDTRKKQKLSNRIGVIYDTVDNMKKQRNIFTRAFYHLRIWYSQRDGYDSPDFFHHDEPGECIFDNEFPRPYKWV